MDGFEYARKVRSDPSIAHIPLILNMDGSKMSKRDKGASLESYAREGYVPEAVVNYLCLLGWSPKGNREIVPLPEVVNLFDLPQILRHNARFDLDKLNWLNWEYLKSMDPERFNRLALQALADAGINTAGFESAYARAALATCQQKVKLLAEVPQFTDFYFNSDFAIDPDAFTKDFIPENRPRLVKLREAFASVPAFDAASIESTLKKVAAELGVKAGALVHPTRLACTGRSIGPSLYHLIEILGRDAVLRRLDRALTRF